MVGSPNESQGEPKFSMASDGSGEYPSISMPGVRQSYEQGYRNGYMDGVLHTTDPIVRKEMRIPPQPLITLKADSAVDAHIYMLGDSFRGLWRSAEIQENGDVVDKWSVTFIYKNKYVDSPYQDSAAAALKYATDIVKPIIPMKEEKDAD